MKDESPPNKSLDASGGSVFRNLLGAAKGALNRAAASTQPLGASRLGEEVDEDQTSIQEPTIETS
jgi:hypothetical protein